MLHFGSRIWQPSRLAMIQARTSDMQADRYERYALPGKADKI